MPKPRTFRRMIAAGIVLLLALGVLALIVRREFLRYQFDLVTYLDDSAGLTPSSPVLMHGIPVGHVRRISLSGSQDPNRAVRIEMRFSREYLSEIPEDSTIGIMASNLLGDKSLDISRGVHAQPITPGTEIRSTPTQDIASVLNRAVGPLKIVDSILARIDSILKYVNESQGSVGLLVNDHTLQNRIARINAGVQQIKTSVKNGRGAALRVSDIEQDAKKPLERFNAIVADLGKPNGTLGLFLHDPNSPSLRTAAAETMDEGRRVLDDVSKDKRPGEAMKQAKLTSDKAGALMGRIDADHGTLGPLLENPQIGVSLKSIDAEFTSFVADFSKHPLRYVQIRLGLF